MELVTGGDRLYSEPVELVRVSVSSGGMVSEHTYPLGCVDATLLVRGASDRAVVTFTLAAHLRDLAEVSMSQPILSLPKLG
ncbi:hypothetical protein [Chamaesiphon sp. OTE_8_metabat_110]|uniref:hypothetical protein n=1 Tax=Chamaesiphon sp. OTE_8_metabat_110 TaxID=2964696 RepID=UPI00286BC087|nr:hypothetical protein [Chamaesiphon sp. OTE_8_metabat_110]